MEWDKITKDYPKAFSLWANYTHYNRTQNKGRLRMLYDFFDLQNIILVIEYQFSHKVNGKLEFSWDVCVDDLPAFESREHYKTRTEAEKEGFLTSFALLENRLK